MRNYELRITNYELGIDFPQVLPIIYHSGFLRLLRKDHPEAGRPESNTKFYWQSGKNFSILRRI